MKALGILLIVAAVALGVAGVALAKRSVFYSSTAVVKVTRDTSDLPELSGISNLPTVGPGADKTVFIETEVALIKSDATVNRVVTQLNLGKAWGDRLNRGNKLDTAESSNLLKQRLQARVGEGTELIQIKAFSEVPAEAADIANATSQAYCDNRADYRRQLAQTALDTVAIKYADMEKQISEAQAKVDRAWQQLDPSLRALAGTNSSSAENDALRNLHSKFSDTLLHYITVSNQLAHFPETNSANSEIVEQLKSRVDKAKAELAALENATTNEMRRIELLKSYQAARVELDDLNERFAPIAKAVEELRNNLRPQSYPPAAIVEQATASNSPDPESNKRQPWILPTAGVTLLMGIGFFATGRHPKKADI